MKLSHSGRETLMQCGEKYRLKYIERLVGPELYSSLFFGSALDEAFTRLLLDKKKEKTEEELRVMDFTAENIFLDKMTTVLHPQYPEQEVYVPNYLQARYFSSDFEEALLKKKHLDELSELYPKITNFIMFQKEVYGKLKDRKQVSEDDIKLYNEIVWTSLVEKGYLMVDAYRRQIMPQIHEVLSIQRKIEITNDNGDTIPGFIDFEAIFVSEPNAVYVCDNKTSKDAYALDSVTTSPQLATYCEATGNTKAAYVVVRKKIFKKAPIIQTQVIKGIVSEQTFQHTFDEFEKAVHTIEEGNFEKNFDACFSFGRMCPYFRLCKHNSMSGLVCKK